MSLNRDVIVNLENSESKSKVNYPDNLGTISDGQSFKDEVGSTARNSIDKDVIDVKIKDEKGRTEIDSPGKSSFQSKKNVAEGMMDIALLTANANQLRFLITFNSGSKTFYFSVGLIILSLVLQIAVGIALIFKRQMKNRGRRNQLSRTNDFLVGGVFMITVINVFVSSFTTTDSETESKP